RDRVAAVPGHHPWRTPRRGPHRRRGRGHPRRRPGGRSVRRLPVYVAVVLVTAMATLFGAPATLAAASPTYAPTDKLCNLAEWQNKLNFDQCAANLRSDITGR